MAEKSCKDRVWQHCDRRLADIDTLINTYDNDPEAYDDELGTNLDEYPLEFAFEPADDPDDTRLPHFRYLLSTGGPHEEIRFFTTYGERLLYAEFWLFDWGDGAKVTIQGSSPYYKTIERLWYTLQDYAPHLGV